MKITPEIKIALDQLIESYGNATQLSKRLRVAHTTVLAWLKPNPPEISGDIWYERLEPLLSGYLSKSSNSISLTGGSIGNVAQNSGRQGAVTQTYAPKGVSTPESSKAEAPSLPEEDRAILEYYRSPENKKARYKLLLEIEELKNPPAPETQKPSTETPTAASKPKEGKAPGGLGALAGTIIGFVKKAINWVVDLVGGQHQQETQESQQQQGSIAITDELSPELIRQLTIGYGSLCAVVSLISTHDLFITGISLLAGMVGIKSAQWFGNQFDAKSKWMQKKLDEWGCPAWIPCACVVAIILGTLPTITAQVIAVAHALFSKLIVSIESNWTLSITAFALISAITAYETWPWLRKVPGIIMRPKRKI